MRPYLAYVATIKISAKNVLSELDFSTITFLDTLLQTKLSIESKWKKMLAGTCQNTEGIYLVLNLEGNENIC
jgi:hypothetical protein